MADSFKLHFLGTGCGRPTAQRFNSSTALEIDGRLTLFDCGAPCTALLKQKGLSPGDVTHIFVSHIHSDHITGLPMLLRETEKSRQNDESELEVDEGVDLFVPEYANPDIMEALAFFSGQNRTPFAETRLHSLTDGGRFAVSPLEVTAHKNRDDGLESYGFLLQVGGKRIFFTGDLPGHFELLKPQLQDLDLLITEAAHLEPEAYAALNEPDIHEIIITHVRWIHHGREEELIASLAEHLPEDRFRLVDDGTTVSL